MSEMSRKLLCVCLLSFLSVNSQQLDQSLWITNGTVFATLTEGTNTYVGGKFSYVGPQTGSTIVLNTNSGTFAPNVPSFNGFVYAIVPDGAGGSYVGGSFYTINGIRQRGIAHLRNDLSVDHAWYPAIGLRTNIAGLACDDDFVYMVGDSTDETGVAYTFLMKANRQTGIIDPSLHCQTNGMIETVALLDSFVYIGGTFTEINGVRVGRIARLSTSNGTVDTSFIYHANGSVHTITIHGGMMYVAGEFGMINSFYTKLAKIDILRNVLDTTCQVQSNSGIRSIATNGTDVFVGGIFTQVNGVTAKHLVRLSGQPLTVDRAFNAYADSIVWSLSLDSSNSLFVGGEFAEFNGTKIPHLVKINARTGSVDQQFRPLPSAGVRALLLNGSQLLAGGYFASANGMFRSNCIKLQKNGSIDPLFDPQVNGVVRCLHLDKNNSLYVGGDFTDIAGLARHKLARLSVTTGEVISSFNPPLLDSTVLSVVSNQTNLFIGGSFSSKIMKVDANTGAVDGTFSTHCRINSDVYCLGLSDSSLFIGGNFTQVSGMNRSHLAKVSLFDGRLDSQFIVDADSAVHALSMSGEYLYVGGKFTTLGSKTQRSIALVNGRLGIVDESFVSSVNGTVLSLAPKGNYIYVGGMFSPIIGVGNQNLMRLLLSGYRDQTFNATTDNVVYSCSVNGGKLVVGGDFINICNKPHFYLGCCQVFSDVQAQNIDTTMVSYTSMAIQWTNGNGSKRAVFMKKGYSGAAQPLDHYNYIPQQQFGLGSQIGSSGWYCVYKGVGDSARIDRLDAGAAYRIMVCEYIGTDEDAIYNLDTAIANPTIIQTKEKMVQVITFQSLSEKTFGDSDFVVKAQINSPLRIHFSSSNPLVATVINDSIIHIIGAGFVEIQASQSGDSIYNAAEVATQTLRVQKAMASIQLSNLSHVYDRTEKSVTAKTSPAGLRVNVRYLQNDQDVPFVNAGKYIVHATIIDSNYTCTKMDTAVITKATAILTFFDTVKTYNSTQQAVTVSSVPSGLRVTLAYLLGRDTVPPINAGVYTVVATMVDSNYSCEHTSTTLHIRKALAGIEFSDTNHTYDGTIHAATAVSAGPAGLKVSLQYSNVHTGSFVEPRNASVYRITAIVVDSNYTGTAEGRLLIAKAVAYVQISDTLQTFDGSAKRITSASLPHGLKSTIQYTTGQSVSTVTPIHAGIYQVTVQIDDENYSGSRNSTLKIEKAAATILFADTFATFDRSVKTVTSQTIPSGLRVIMQYTTAQSSLSTDPINAGTYIVTGTIDDADYYGTQTTHLRINKALAKVTFADTVKRYTGDVQEMTVYSSPSGLKVAISYVRDGETVIEPRNAGSYQIIPAMIDSNYTTIDKGTLIITKALLTIKAENAARAFGEPNPSFTVSYSGYAPADVARSIIHNPLIQTAAEQTSPVGTYPITVSGFEATNYEPVYVAGVLTVRPATQRILFNQIASKNTKSMDFNPGAVATSGLPVVYGSSNTSVVSIVNSMIHIVGPGQAIITAYQTGNHNYEAAVPVTQTILVDLSTSLASDNSVVQKELQKHPTVVALPSVVRLSQNISFFVKTTIQLTILDVVVYNAVGSVVYKKVCNTRCERAGDSLVVSFNSSLLKNSGTYCALIKFKDATGSVRTTKTYFGVQE